MTIRPRFVSSAWHGIYTVEFTQAYVEQACTTLGAAIRQRKLTCVVAYDTRFMSNLFALSAYHILEQHGVAVVLCPSPTPLPALQYSLKAGQCTVLITAGNMPYWYNGITVIEPIGATRLPDVRPPTAVVAFASGAFPIPDPPPSPQAMVTAVERTRDVRGEYLDMLRTLIDLDAIRSATMTIIVDVMNGTTAGLLPAVIGEGSYTKAVEINREADPLFSYTTPLPAAASLARLRKLVHESDSHLGLAFSADGTALMVIDKNGEPVDPLELALVLASYLVRQQRQRGVVVAPPPLAGSPLEAAAQHLATWEQALGFKVELSQHVAARVAELAAQEHNTLLIGMTAVGECVLSRYTSYPDALISGLLLLELIARSGGSLRSQLDAVRSRLGASSP